MSDNVVYLSAFKKEPTQNVVNEFLTEVVDYYNSALVRFDIDTQNLDTAFDVATIQFLLRGMAHRSQGEQHPSQIILNALKDKMLP
jgi:hypothetical protein